MVKWRWRYVLVLILVTAGKAGFCTDLRELFEASSRPNIDAGAYIWGAAVAGQTGYPDTFNGMGNSLHFDDDLGYSSVVLAPLLKVCLRPLHNWQVRFSYWYVSQSGSSKLNKPVLFGDAVFPAGEELESTLTAQSIDGLIAYRLLSAEKFGLYVLGGLNFSWFEQKVHNAEEQTFGFTQTASVLGIGAGCDITPHFGIDGMAVGYIRKSVGIDEYLAITDWSFNWRFLDGTRLGIGYRGYWLSAEDEDEHFRMALSGPYIGFSYAF